MATSLRDARLLIVGGTSGIALETARQARDAGATVILGGRDRERTEVRAGTAGVTADVVELDLADESSVRSAAASVGAIDGVVSFAANHANGPVRELDPKALHAAFDAKVVGPVLLAKHLDLADEGALVLVTGVAAHRPTPGLAMMATLNGAANTLARALAVELAPRRVVAVSPGIVDSGVWDGRKDYLRTVAERLPVKRIGRPADIAAAVLLALTNPFLTGTTIDVDGGGQLA